MNTVKRVRTFEELKACEKPSKQTKRNLNVHRMFKKLIQEIRSSARNQELLKRRDLG